MTKRPRMLAHQLKSSKMSLPVLHDSALSRCNNCSVLFSLFWQGFFLTTLFCLVLVNAAHPVTVSHIKSIKYQTCVVPRKWDIFQVFVQLKGVTFDHEDVADLTFLSNVNGLKLHESDYHVVSVHIPTKNASYTMHLSKPDDLFSPEHLGIMEQVEHYECVYTGSLTSSDGKAAGMASLSSCFDETGFEGLLFLDNDHYQLTPSSPNSPLRRHKRFANKACQNCKLTVRHLIGKPKMSYSTASVTQKHRTDSRYVPDEELKKARLQMVTDQNGLDDEKDDDDEDDDKGEDDVGQVLLGTLAFPKSPSNNNGHEELDNTNFRNRMQTKKVKKKLAKVIELGIFTDEAFYRKWAQKYPEDTVKKINQYILALVNNMNYLYQQPSMGPEITFRLVNLAIQKDIPSGLMPTTIAEKYLDSFCKFAGVKDKNGAIWDHAMMITGLELVDQTGGDNLGIAFTSTMCLRYWSCSLVEYNKGFETAFTASHEMGHSLGIEHDGEDMNKKCDPSKFIMAAIAGSGQINWSQCSNSNVKNFLESGDNRSKVKDPSSIPRCLTKKGSKRSGIRYRTGKYPGKVFNAKRQCQQGCGENCTPYTANKAPYNNICTMLHCQDASKNIVPLHPALEGTSCGQAKQRMCRNGKCYGTI